MLLLRNFENIQDEFNIQETSNEIIYLVHYRWKCTINKEIIEQLSSLEALENLLNWGEFTTSELQCEIVH